MRQPTHPNGMGNGDDRKGRPYANEQKSGRTEASVRPLYLGLPRSKEKSRNEEEGMEEKKP